MADFHITSFDKAHYERLITYLRSVEHDLDVNPAMLGPSTALKLDPTITGMLKPGSPNWDVAKKFVDQAGVFATSAHTRYSDLTTELLAYVTALKNAEEIFKHTNDLTKETAGKLMKEHPEIIGQNT
ncbi:hypothetical protein [Actinoallomurus sp. NPDC050550]|uniref:hypothetical protein n=1 Tax=Actinoallomurus sp. NPDC050550 TaxID=3154937 RepID=UPI003405A11F